MIFQISHQSKVLKLKFEIVGWKQGDKASHSKCDRTIREYLDNWSVISTRNRTN